MIGTGRELLYIISLRHGWHKNLTEVPAKTRYWWSFLIRKGRFGEEMCDYILPMFGAKKIRDAEVFPAIFIGPHKQKLDEVSLVKMIISKRQWYEGVVEKSTSRNFYLKKWHTMRIETIETMVSHFGWTLYDGRHANSSLWELKQELDDRFDLHSNYREPYERDIQKTGTELFIKKSWGLKHDYAHGEKTARDKKGK